MSHLYRDFIFRVYSFVSWIGYNSYTAVCLPVRVIKPGRVAQSVGHQTRKSGVLGLIPGLATYFRFSFRFFKKGSCQLLVNRLGGLSLPRKSVVRLTDRPDMTLDVYCGRKTTTQQQQRVIK